MNLLVPVVPGSLDDAIPDPLTTPPEWSDAVSTTVLLMDLLGVFAFAVSGALLAVRKGFDIVGALLLGSLVGLGGGTIRDLIINDRVPFAFSDPRYLIPPVLAALLVYLRVISPHRLHRTLTVFDAIGLSLFCVVGTRVALLADIHPVPAALLGTTTAVGGGLLRDVVANETPSLFNSKGVYAVPAMFGAALTALLGTVGWLNIITAAAVAILVFAFRLIALRYEWAVPAAEYTGAFRARMLVRERVQRRREEASSKNTGSTDDADPGTRDGTDTSE